MMEQFLDHHEIFSALDEPGGAGAAQIADLDVRASGFPTQFPPPIAHGRAGPRPLGGFAGEDLGSGPRKLAEQIATHRGQREQLPAAVLRFRFVPERRVQIHVPPLFEA